MSAGHTKKKATHEWAAFFLPPARQPPGISPRPKPDSSPSGGLSLVVPDRLAASGRRSRPPCGVQELRMYADPEGSGAGFLRMGIRWKPSRTCGDTSRLGPKTWVGVCRCFWPAAPLASRPFDRCAGHRLQRSLPFGPRSTPLSADVPAPSGASPLDRPRLATPKSHPTGSDRDLPSRPLQPKPKLRSTPSGPGRSSRRASRAALRTARSFRLGVARPPSRWAHRLWWCVAGWGLLPLVFRPAQALPHAA